MLTHHKHLLVLGHCCAQLQAGSNSHSLLDGQVGVQLIVLHNVRRQFTEVAQVALLAVHCDRTDDVGRPG